MAGLPPPHSMCHLLAAASYDQSHWTTHPYQFGAFAATNDSANCASSEGATQRTQQSPFYAQPIKNESQYGDPSCYSITPLGTASSEGTSAAVDNSQLYTSSSSLDHHHQQHHQYSSALNLFASGAYPATPAALMHSAMGPLLGSGGTLGVLSGNEESEQMKRDKDLIYSHPLFPLLTVLFQKCELATCTPREPFREGDQVDTSHVCSASSFDEDLAEFAKTVQVNKPYYVPNAELDSLMLNSIQVLRYHLLELEKVHELCDNFCTKYVNKIKERTQMDINAGEQAPPPPHPQNLDHQITQHRQMHHQMAPQSANASTTTMEQQQQQQQQMRTSHFTMGTQFGDGGGVEQMGAHIESLHQQPCSSAPMQMSGFLDLSSSATPSSAVHSNASAVGTPAGVEFDQTAHFYVQPPQHHFVRTAAMSGGGGMGDHFEGKRKSHKKAKVCEQHNDLSAAGQPSPDTTARADAQSTGCGGTGSRSSTATAMGSGEEQLHQLINGDTMNQIHQQNNANGGGLAEENGDDFFSNCGDSMGEERDSAGSEGEQKPFVGGGQKRSAEESGAEGHRKKVPKVFSKEAISKFRAWLFNNITHPYPTEEQKKQLATETGLTILQVNNWFINARRRIVQPMIDSNNRAGRSVQVFKNRRRKSSGGVGTPPSPAPEGHSPELLLNGGGTASRNGATFGGSPEDPSTAVSASNGGSSSVSNCSASSLRSLHASAPPGSSAQQSSPLLASAAAGIVVPLSSPATASVMPSYQANAAAAAAVAAVTNPYANFGGATAGFPFAGIGGVSSMIAPYALNSMAGGWAGIDLNSTHQGNLDG
ncbi:hypothetical protein niasHT_015937 [Heterodera trifolii]|uniref:Homeobox protein unc-62 n=1 Tax=Heterodera trifolii TaxID=157864 RepID=A0ABD2LC18_9BILA